MEIIIIAILTTLLLLVFASMLLVYYKLRDIVERLEPTKPKDANRHLKIDDGVVIKCGIDTVIYNPIAYSVTLGVKDAHSRIYELDGSKNINSITTNHVTIYYCTADEYSEYERKLNDPSIIDKLSIINQPRQLTFDSSPSYRVTYIK